MTSSLNSSSLNSSKLKQQGEGHKLRPKASHHLLLLLDYDGTLTPIVKTPREAKFPPKTRALVKRLSKHPLVTLAVISGRQLENVKKMVRLPRLIYSGNHGLELKGGGYEFLNPKARKATKALESISKQLKKELAHIPNALIEDKQLTLSVHYRLVSKRKIALVKRIVHRISKPWRKRKLVRLTRGKCVIEVRPNTTWDKGAVVEWLAKQVEQKTKPKKLFPIYIGDDVTDESAFRAVNRLKGASFLVRERARKTSAQYRITSASNVARFLGWVEKNV